MKSARSAKKRKPSAAGAPLTLDGDVKRLEAQLVKRALSGQGLLKQACLAVRQLEERWRGEEVRLGEAVAVVSWRQGLAVSPDALRSALIYLVLCSGGRVSDRLTKEASEVSRALKRFDNRPKDQLEIELKSAGGVDQLLRHEPDSPLVKRAKRIGAKYAATKDEREKKKLMRAARPARGATVRRKALVK